jgi:hypothetical protein
LLTGGKRHAPRIVIQKYKISIECWGLIPPTVYSMIITGEKIVGKYLNEAFEAADKTRILIKAPRVKIKAGIPKARVSSTRVL